jgi:HEAT repeat protein
VAAVDGLTAIGLNRDANESIRLEAIEALCDLGKATTRPLWEALTQDPSPRVRARALKAKNGRPAHPAGISSTERLAAMADQGLPDDPDAVSRLLTAEGASAPAHFHRLVERIREREAAEAPVRRGAWTRARGSAHVALAKRDSLLGLYDLRESLESANGPLPVEFLAAVALIGDASCLDAIAMAHSRATDRWWREHLADAFQAIVKRKKLTGRHAVMKRIQKRWPAILRMS